MHTKQLAFIFLLFILISVPSIAQISQDQDWANFAYYSKANSKVDHRPIAVFIGDSITDNWDDKDLAFFTDNDILCRGISGQTTSQMLIRFRKDVVAHHPKYVLIMAGTNDIACNTGYIALDNIVGNIQSMCEIARANKIRPIIVSITPSTAYPWRPSVKDVAGKIMKVNKMLETYAKENRIRYIDLHAAMKDEHNGLPKQLSTDGVHPTLEGYAVMAPLILDALK